MRERRIWATGWAVAAIGLLIGAGHTPSKAGGIRELDLENAVASADLVLAVEVAELTEVKVVLGGKMAQSSQQFVFKPARTLKGVFARETLLLTSGDLRAYDFGEGTGQLERGQLRLLVLGRQGPGYVNANSVSSLDLSLPLLRDLNDPLLASVATLIEVTQERDRGKRAALLLAGLRAAKGASAIPLCASLQRRATLAAQTPGAIAAVADRLKDPSPDVRATAAQTLQSLLAADYLDQRDERAGAVKALVGAIRDGGPDLSARLAALSALGAAGAAARQEPAVLGLLRLDRPTNTFAEGSARLQALGQLKLADQREQVSAYLDDLPLDAPEGAQVAAASALAKLDPARALDRIRLRIDKKRRAGLPIPLEIRLLGELPSQDAAPLLRDLFAKSELSFGEKQEFANACLQAPDPRLVPALSTLLDPRREGLRGTAIVALRKIDSDAAALALRPHLAEEPHLANKLMIAEFLGRHGFADGHPYAIEHMSEPNLTEEAVAALAAIHAPGTAAELRRIWETSHDLHWNRAAIRGLGRLGVKDLAPRMLGVAKDLRDPLAPSALLALSDLGEPKALPIVREGLSSRNDEIVAVSVRAAGKLLAPRDVKADDVRDRLAALLADPDAAQPVRTAALEALSAIQDPRLERALAVAVRDAGLEGSYLLNQIERLLDERKVRLNLP